MPTTNLQLDLLTTSQSNKETTINDALVKLEDATQTSFDIDLTGLTAYTFTSEWYSNFIFNASGNIVDVTFTLPSTERVFGIRNSSAHMLDITFDGSTVVHSIQAGESFLYHSSGTVLTVLVQYEGVETVPIVTESGTTHTPSLIQANSYIRYTSGTTVTVTIQNDATVNFPIGTTLNMRQAAAGQVQLTNGSGVTINTPETTNSRKQGASLALIKVASDEWDLTGDLETL